MTRFRRLTPAEIAALPAGLVAAIDVASVGLTTTPHPLSHLSRALRGYAVILVRGQHVFWPGLPDDMSHDPEAMTLLGHELVHVWQYANGMNVVSYVLRDVIGNLGRYAYRLRPDKAYDAYSYEQQAAMVEDWMRLDAGLGARWCRGIDKAALEALVPFLK